jgi:hypothetical protein
VAFREINFHFYQVDQKTQNKQKAYTKCSMAD